MNKDHITPLKKTYLCKNLKIQKLKKDAIQKLTGHLSNKTLRGDYFECVQLCLMFLGEKVPGFTFKAPQGLSLVNFVSGFLKFKPILW